MRSKTKEKLNKLEDLWVKYYLLICIFFGSVVGLLHYFRFIENVRDMVANAINFGSIVIGVTGVFLTLIVTLQESPVFERLKQFFPSIQTKLYRTLQWQIYFSLILVIMSILIISMPAAPLRIFASLGVTIWFTFFWLVSLGSFYSVKLITDLVVRNFDIPTRDSRM